MKSQIDDATHKLVECLDRVGLEESLDSLVHRVEEETEEPDKLESDLEKNVLESVINNDSLSVSQMSEILDAAKNDMRVMDSLVEIERKNQDEMLASATLYHTAEEEENDENSLSSKFSEAQAELERKLKEDHDKKLKSLMRSGSTVLDDIVSDDHTAFHDNRVLALCESRHTILMRYLGAYSKFSMIKAYNDFESSRLKEECSLLESGKSEGEINKVLVERLGDEDRQLRALAIDLEKKCDAEEADEDSVRESWVADVASVNVEDEIEALRIKTDAKLQELGRLLDVVSDQMLANLQQSKAVKLLALKRCLDEYDPDTYAVKEKAINDEYIASMESLKTLISENSRLVGEDEHGIRYV
jgi:hypothetical protein